LVVLSLLLSALLTACGGEEAPASQSEASSGESAAAEAAPSGGEIIGVYASGRSLANLNPFTSVNDEEVIMLNVYETLTFYGLDGKVQPKLAESWEVSDDGLEWTFKLQEGVKFQGGGELNAEAVKYSLERAQATDLFPHLATITGIEAVDDTTVKFSTSIPVNLPLILTSRFGTYVVSPTTDDKESDWFNSGNSERMVIPPSVTTKSETYPSTGLAEIPEKPSEPPHSNPRINLLKGAALLCI